MARWALAIAALGAIGGCDLVSGLDDYELTRGAGGAGQGAAGEGASGGGGSGGSTNGGGGVGGSGGSSVPATLSCQANLPGAGNSCGLDGSDNCCTSIPVEGGTYLRSYQVCDADGNQAFFSATVSAFRLDKYEVTVGRYRQFIESFDGTSVVPGVGEHERIADSGWQGTFPTQRRQDLLADVRCSGGTWTNEPGANEVLPVACVDWYAALLFCAWDGGRLPTEAEYNYVAAHGDSHSQYPWGSTMVNDTLAVYTCDGCAVTPVAPVGSKPAGESAWGHLDLVGNVREWMLDASLLEGPSQCNYPSPCTDCAHLEFVDDRIQRGGGHEDFYAVRSDVRRARPADSINTDTGFRCARPAASR